MVGADSESTESGAAFASWAVVGVDSDLTESGAPYASWAVVGAGTVLTENSAASASWAVVGAGTVLTESSAAGASRAVVASSHWSTPLPSTASLLVCALHRVPQSHLYAGRACVAALLLTVPAQMIVPIDADDGCLRPDLLIARLKSQAPVEVLWVGEWWYLSHFLSLGRVGDVFSCVAITTSSLRLMSVLAGETGRL